MKQMISLQEFLDTIRPAKLRTRILNGCMGIFCQQDRWRNSNFIGIWQGAEMQAEWQIALKEPAASLLNSVSMTKIFKLKNFGKMSMTAVYKHAIKHEIEFMDTQWYAEFGPTRLVKELRYKWERLECDLRNLRAENFELKKQLETLDQK